MVVGALLPAGKEGTNTEATTPKKGMCAKKTSFHKPSGTELKIIVPCPNADWLLSSPAQAFDNSRCATAWHLKSKHAGAKHKEEDAGAVEQGRTRNMVPPALPMHDLASLRATTTVRSTPSSR